MKPTRFQVEVTTPDGQRRSHTATGGHSLDHALAAMERAGLGSVVRVRPRPAAPVQAGATTQAVRDLLAARMSGFPLISGVTR